MKTLSAVDILLASFDHAWKHPWESVKSSLVDVNDEMAVWQPPAYKNEPAQHDRPAGSIRWHLIHLTLCKMEYAHLILKRPNTFEGNFESPVGSVESLKTALHEAHKKLRDAVAALSCENLTEQTGREIPVHEFVAACIRHDVWHAAQIKMVQRLWAHR